MYIDFTHEEIVEIGLALSLALISGGVSKTAITVPALDKCTAALRAIRLEHEKVNKTS